MWWIVMALLIALVDWWALWARRQRWDYVAKPGVMVALLLALITGPGSAHTRWFAAGVFFSLVGDVLLMLPREQFEGGIGAFFLAHVFYIVGFRSQCRYRHPAQVLLLAIHVLIAWAVGRPVLEGVKNSGHPRLRGPVAAYMGVLVAMHFCAWLTWWHTPSVGKALAISAGATLFLLSDTLLAWNRFVARIHQARLKVRILYHVGQILLIGGVIGVFG
ncbi:MAG: lysoplasmalogenase [Chloroflexi bacterium]|nr:lysoplasmalogenase [Chloroflexota bacterium]